MKMSPGWLVISLCLAAGALADEVDEEMEDQGVMKIIRAMTNQTKADTLNLPSNATSIRENITDTFSCDNRTYGYYADVDNDCQVFHVCLPSKTRSNQNVTYRYSFICPQETVFNQEVLVCTREIDSIECSESPMYYHLNMEMGKVDNDTNEEPMGTDNIDYDNEKPTENAMDSENTAKTGNDKPKLMKPLPPRKRNKPKSVSQNGQRKNVKNEKIIIKSHTKFIKDARANDLEKQEIRILKNDQTAININEDKKGEIEEVKNNNNKDMIIVENDMNAGTVKEWMEEMNEDEGNNKLTGKADTGQIKELEKTKETKKQKEESDKDLKAEVKNKKNHDIRKSRKMHRRLDRGFIRFTADVK